MHAEESGERTQDMMGPRVMLPLQHKKSDPCFYAWGPFFSFLASPRCGRPKVYATVVQS
jgi:hypothetical protein